MLSYQRGQFNMRLNRFIQILSILFIFQLTFGAINPTTTVDNFPANYPLPSGQLATLTPPATYPVTQSGAFAVSLTGSLNGAATSANQALGLSLATSSDNTLTAIKNLQTTANGYLSSLDSKLTNPLPVSVSSIPLASGASTAALQTTGNGFLSSIDSKLTNPLPVSGAFFQATQPISAAALPLPSGASTLTEQQSQTTKLTSIDSKLGGVLTVSGTLSTVPTGTQVVSGSVSVSNFPAIQGVSGTFYQATQPVSLASVPSHAVTVTSGTVQVGPGSSAIGSVSVTSGTVQLGAGSNTVGAISNTSFAATQATGSNLHTVVDSGAITVSQGTASNLKVQAETHQGGTAVSAANPLWTQTSGTTQVSGTVSANVIGTVPVSGPLTDTQLRASVIPVSLPSGVSVSNTVTVAGSVSVTSGTVQLGAGSAIVGKFGIDQTTPGTTNLVALAANQSVNAAQINGVTPLMGNGVTGTGSLRVTLASDTTSNTNPLLFNQSQVNGTALLAGAGPTGTGAQRVVQANIASATLANVSSSATTVTLLASAAARMGATFFNESSAILYLKYGATASLTSYTVQIQPGGYYEMPQPIYSGIVDGLWSSASGTVRVTSW